MAVRVSSTGVAYGVRETLAELRKLDPTLQRAARKRIRSAMSPIVSDAKRQLGSTPPLSGMAHRGRTGWLARGARSVTATVGGRARRGVWPLARVQLRGAAGSIYDMAGRATPGAPLAAALRSAGHGQPSRAMWPAAEAHTAGVQASIRRAVDDAAAELNRHLDDMPRGV